MRKCKVKAPKYAFGASEIGNMLQAGGNIAQGINGGNQTALAVFSGIGETLGNVPVIGKFAKIAADVGKIGTAIVGTKGKVDEVTGEITEGSGILGRRNRNKLRLQSGMVKNNIAAALHSADVAAEWYSLNGYNGLSYARGGVTPNTFAYFDDGESFRYPDGLIGTVPELGKPKDSNLVNVPVGTLVISDTLKPKGSKETYAEIYKKNKAKTNMKGNDVYALNSKKLNEIYNENLFSSIINMQESSKKSKSKPDKYAKGTAGIPDFVKRDKTNLASIVNNINAPIKNRPYGDLGSLELARNNMYAPIIRPYGNLGAPGLESKFFPSISDLKTKTASNSGSLNNLAGTTAGIIGPLMNITAKRGESNVPYTYTPKFGPKDYNINPLLRSIDNTYSMANYNMANINPNTGAGMAYGLQAAINRDKQMADAYSTKNNQENAMAMQNASIYNQWGQFNANAQHTAAIENAQDLAAVESARRLGWSDLSTAMQTMSKDRRLTKRDMMMMAAMKPYLSKGMTGDQIDKLYSYFG